MNDAIRGRELVIVRGERYNTKRREKQAQKGAVDMGFVYALLWAVIGLILIFSAAKENKVFYFAGAFFLLLGAWWGADALFPESGFFSGGWRAALNIVTLAALAGLSVVFFIERNRSIKREIAEKKMSQPDDPDDPGMNF